MRIASIIFGVLTEIAMIELFASGDIDGGIAALIIGAAFITVPIISKKIKRNKTRERAMREALSKAKPEDFLPDEDDDEDEDAD